MRLRLISLGLAVALLPSVALAWGNEGHQIVAAIARDGLTPKARAWVDAMLAADPDTSTAPDMLSRATWADAYRASHRETASWHFVDIEMANPDLRTACFGYPKPVDPASSGPAQDCVVDKINEFETELSNPATPMPERILALKFLLHFVGDVHQPLHAADRQDRGGNCFDVTVNGQTMNLHAYWDTGVVTPLGGDPVAVARALEAEITPSERKAWSGGTPSTWAQESYEVARSTAYAVQPAEHPFALMGTACDIRQPPVALSADYQANAQAEAKIQLEKAGVRLAWALNLAAERAGRR